MYSGVASGIFAIRNCEKTTNGDIGRLPVSIGQTAGVLKASAQYNNALSKQAKVVLNTFDEIAKSDKLFKGLTKVVNFAADNVNPLIVVSSGVKVAMADKEERKNTLITETGTLAGMFLGEGWMKKHLDGILDQLPINKKWIPIIKGVTFVAGSISASTLGNKIGKKAAEYWDKPLCKEETTQTQHSTKNTKVYEPLSVKA